MIAIVLIPRIIGAKLISIKGVCISDIMEIIPPPNYEPDNGPDKDNRGDRGSTLSKDRSRRSPRIMRKQLDSALRGKGF